MPAPDEKGAEQQQRKLPAEAGGVDLIPTAPPLRVERQLFGEFLWRGQHGRDGPLLVAGVVVVVLGKQGHLEQHHWSVRGRFLDRQQLALERRRERFRIAVEVALPVHHLFHQAVVQPAVVVRCYF